MKDNLYILRVYGKEGNSVIKFGYSSKIQTRLKQYLDCNPLVEIVNTYYREDAKEFERSFHKNNNSFIRNEWYLEEQLENIIYQIHNGITSNEKFQKLIIKKKNNVKTFEIINITDKNVLIVKKLNLVLNIINVQRLEMNYIINVKFVEVNLELNIKIKVENILEII